MGARLRPTAATIAVFVCTLASDVSSLAVQNVESPVVLEPGTVVERAIAGGQTHRYEVTLQAGEQASVSISQRGIDVLAGVFDPVGKQIAQFNEEMKTAGDEHIEITGTAGGRYGLLVKTVFPRAAAGSYSIRRTETRRATDRDRSVQEVRALRAEYVPMVENYQTDAARPLVERALSLAEAIPHPDDLFVAVITRDLATVYQHAIDRAKAAALFEQAAAVYEKVLGADNPRTASLWNSLAAQYGPLGQRPMAEKLAQRALEVSEKALGPDHPQVASCLTTVANLRVDAGDLDEAERLYRRSLLITEHTYGPDDFENARYLNNLGSTLLDQGNFAGAESFLQRGLAIEERKLGPDALELAITLQNLGVVARQQKEVAKAEAYYLRALAIRQKYLRPDHPDIALNLNNLAIIYRMKGDVERSLATHFQVLSIWEKSAGPYNSGTLITLGNIARTYAGQGDIPNAIAFQRRVDAAIERDLTLNLAIGSERQKLALVNGLPDRTARTISLDVATGFKEPGATALAALVVLQRKGRVFEAMVDTRAGVRDRLGSAHDQELLDRLSTTTTQLARVALNDPSDAESPGRLQRISELEAQKEKLESELSEDSAEFRVESQPVTLAAVQALLPRDTALLEFAVYRPFDPRADRNADAYGAPHYVAYLLERDGPPHGADLGLAQEIDTLVDRLRASLRDPARDDVTVNARAVDARVLQPVRVLLGNATRLLISPDGELNLIPFEALRDERGRYAIERYTISYLSSGRDLVRMQVPRTHNTGPIVVADPEFGDPPVTSGAAAAAPRINSPRRSITSVDDLPSAYFAPLSGTAEEARQIKAFFPDATVLTGTLATKSALTRAQAPRILHIATHGFFLQDPKHKIANPLLRSGLALSGANLNRTSTPGQDEESGILTALEASNLDLWGTKLVTLSACDTGVGEVKNGEGVYGLRRAFLLAGAETLVMSLWPVSDYVTRQMMTSYYGGLNKGLGRGEALRQAELSMRARKGLQHPFYWASFIQAGDWTPLDR